MLPQSGGDGEGLLGPAMAKFIALAVSGRAGIAVTRRLGTPPVTFPGGHDGFLGGEYGQMGKPDAFAATLREVLSGA